MKLKVKDERGKFKKNQSIEIRDKIIDWFQRNPDSTRNEACAALGIGRTTLFLHLKAIQEEL